MLRNHGFQNHRRARILQAPEVVTGYHATGQHPGQVGFLELAVKKQLQNFTGKFRNAQAVFLLRLPGRKAR